MLWCHYSPQTNPSHPNHPHRLGGQQTGPKTFINNEAEGRRTTSDDCVLEIHIYQPESPVHTRLSFPNPQSPKSRPTFYPQGPLHSKTAHSVPYFSGRRLTFFPVTFDFWMDFTLMIGRSGCIEKVQIALRL